MLIQTPETPDSALFDSLQEFHTGLLSGGGEPALHMTIGKPVQWQEGALMGEGWQQPVGGHSYFLTRFAFSLRPYSGTVQNADFYISIGSVDGQQGYIFDAFPVDQVDEVKHPVTLSVGPSFKLGAADASIASASTTIDFGHLQPVISTDGLSEARFHWHFEATHKYPLTGFRMMYAVIALPPGVRSANVTLELSAEVWAFKLCTVHFGTKTVGKTLEWMVGHDVLPDAARKENGDIAWDWLYHDVSHIQEQDLRSPYQTIRLVARKGDLEGADLIFWNGSTDVTLPLLKVPPESGPTEPPCLFADLGFSPENSEIWQSILPTGQRLYYRIRVKNGDRVAFLKAGNSAGGAYRNPHSQFVREFDVPDRDNYWLA